MPKRFKTKKKKPLFNLFLILLIIYISFISTFKFFSQKITSISIDSNKYLKYLLKTGFNNQINNYKYFNLFDPASLLGESLNTNIEINDPKPVEEIIEELPNNISNPKVYIYNTHQTEEYNFTTVNDYNLKPTVLLASYYLKEKLNDYGIPTILETNSISNILKQNDWNYAYSYQASRILMEDALKNNPSLEFFIDFHRDSSVYDKTTFTIDNQKYVKILFIVGKENPNYEANLTITKELNNRFISLNPEISRGIYQKYGPGVNGVYNQDFHPNTILMEFGGQYNTIEEVSNTIDLISKTLAQYIKETYEKEK